MDPRKEQDRKNAAWRVWYKANRQSVIQKAVQRNRRRYHRNKVWLKDIKKTLKCERCGFDNPAALQFHHKNPKTKEITIAKVLTQGWGRERILKEIAKCEVLCANCHAVEHHGSLF